MVNQTNVSIKINSRYDLGYDIISLHQGSIQLQNLHYQLLEHKCKINKDKQKSTRMQT